MKSAAEIQKRPPIGGLEEINRNKMECTLRNMFCGFAFIADYSESQDRSFKRGGKKSSIGNWIFLNISQGSPFME